MENVGTCKSCTKRTVEPNCHTNCEAYKEFVKLQHQNRVRDSIGDRYIYQRQMNIKMKKNKERLRK